MKKVYLYKSNHYGSLYFTYGKPYHDAEMVIFRRYNGRLIQDLEANAFIHGYGQTELDEMFSPVDITCTIS